MGGIVKGHKKGGIVQRVKRGGGHSERNQSIFLRGKFENLFWGHKQTRCRQFSKDESHFIHSPHPDCVVFPNSTEEVSNIMKFCNENLVSVVPFGTGTGLEGGVSCPEFSGRPTVSLNMMNMSEITQVNAEDFDVSVQPGVG